MLRPQPPGVRALVGQVLSEDVQACFTNDAKELAQAASQLLEEKPDPQDWGKDAHHVATLVDHVVVAYLGYGIFEEVVQGKHGLLATAQEIDQPDETTISREAWGTKWAEKFQGDGPLMKELQELTVSLLHMHVDPKKLERFTQVPPAVSE